MIFENFGHSLMEKGSVDICYCHHGVVRGEFTNSLMKLLMYDLSLPKGKGRVYSFGTACSPYGALSRNLGVENFLKNKSEWLLFLNGDMSFEPDLLDKLLSVADEGHKIIGGLHFTFLPGNIIGPAWFKDGDGLRPVSVGEIEREGGPVELAAMSLSGALVHRSVLEKIGEKYTEQDSWPWFGYDLAESADASTRLGEDRTFCHRAKEAGFKIWGFPGAVLDTHCKTVRLDTNGSKNQFGIEKGSIEVVAGMIATEFLDCLVEVAPFII